VELDPSSWGNSWQEKNSLALFRGPTSVSDNAFERAQRLMKIAILIHENSDEIRTQMTRSPELKKSCASNCVGLPKLSKMSVKCFVNKVKWSLSSPTVAKRQPSASTPANHP
jgi:hypothetical protein